MYPQKAGSYYLGIIEYQVVVAVFFFVGESMLFHRQSVWKEVVVIVVS